MGAHDSLLFRETGAEAPFGRFSVMSCPRIVGFAEGFVCRGGAYHTAPAGGKQNPAAAALRKERRSSGNLAFWPCMQWNRSGKGPLQERFRREGRNLTADSRIRRGGGAPRRRPTYG